KEALESIGITGLEGLSKDLFAQYKSGSHLLVVSSAMDDTIPGIITSVFHKVNRAFEGSPRAIIVCSTIDEAERVFERMQRPARKLDVTIDLAHDKGNILQQR